MKSAVNYKDKNMKKIKLLIAIACSATLTVSTNAAEVIIKDSPKLKEAKVFQSAAIFRADQGRTGCFDKTGVVNKPSVKWKTDLGGKIISSPVVWDGTLFIGSPKGLHALNAETGQEKWLFKVKNGVNSSVAVADGLVFFTGMDNNLYGVTVADGKKKWTVKGTKPSKEGVKGLSGAPLIVYGMVVSPMGRGTIAVDYQTGKKIYSIKESPAAYGGLAASKDRLFLRHGYDWNRVYGYEIETGRKVLEKGSAWIAVNHGVSVRNGKVYAIGTRGVICHDATNDCAEPKSKDGVEIWKASLLQYAIDDNEYIESTGASLWENLVFWGNDQGWFFALDDKTGNVKWKKEIGAFMHSTPSIAAKSGIVYFGTFDTNLYAFNAKTGAKKWKFKTGGIVDASPWIDDDLLYISSHDGFVYCLQ